MATKRIVFFIGNIIVIIKEMYFPQPHRLTFHQAVMVALPVMIAMSCNLIYPYDIQNKPHHLNDSAVDVARNLSSSDIKASLDKAQVVADNTMTDQSPISDGFSILPLEHLLASYTFDNSMTDGSKNNRDLTATTINYVTGIHQKALRVTEQSSVESADTCSQEEPILFASFDLWFKPEAMPPGTNRAMLLDRNGFFGAMFFADGRVHCRVSVAADAIATSSAVVGQWTHVACVVDESTHYIYINGNLADTADVTGTYQKSTPCVSIGQELPSYGDRFTGLIDDLHLWNIALNENEVRAAMNFSQ